MNRLKNLHGLFLVFGTLCVAGALSVAYAQPIAEPGCDPEFMDAVEARAYLGVQRRIMQNQNLILKPDSVLEYSCFNQQVGFFAATPVRRFSEDNISWGDVTAVHSETLDYALFETVSKPLLEYLNGTYSHTFLGGRMADVGGSPPDYGLYDCQAMQAVWEVARCMQFNDNEDTDGFYDFPWYANTDPRRVPDIYAACTPPTSTINAAIVEAHRATGDDSGQEYRLFVLETENDPAADFTLYEEDPMTVQDVTDPMLPDDCGSSLTIPTGVTVAVPGRTTYQENVCLMPACSYNGTECILD